MKTSVDFSEIKGLDKYTATIGGTEYAVSDVTDYTRYNDEDNNYCYEIDVLVFDDVSGTKDVYLTYPDGADSTRTIGGVSITLNKEDYFKTKGTKEVELENTNDLLYVSSKTEGEKIDVDGGHSVSVFSEKGDRQIKKAYLVNGNGKDSNHYNLNMEIIRISGETAMRDDRYPAKKMPFAKEGSNYNSQYTYGFCLEFYSLEIIEGAIPNGTYNMVFETGNGCKTTIKNAVVSTDKPVILGMKDSESSGGDASTDYKLYGNDTEIHTDKHGDCVLVYVYGLNLDDEVAKYVKPYFRDYNTVGADSIIGTCNEENGYEVAKNGIFYEISTETKKTFLCCSIDSSEYETKYGKDSIIIDESLKEGKTIEFQRPVLYGEQGDAAHQTSRIYIADDIANVGDIVKVKLKVTYGEGEKELECKVQERTYGTRKKKYIEITKADVEDIARVDLDYDGEYPCFFSITEISVNGEVYNSLGMSHLNGTFEIYINMNYKPEDSVRASNGVFRVGDYTKEQDVILEFHHPNEIETLLEISIPKGTEKYFLTTEDMKVLTEGEEYRYCIRRAEDHRAVLFRRWERVEKGFESASISLSENPPTTSTVVSLKHADSSVKLFYCVLTEQDFWNKYGFQTESVPANMWIAYTDSCTPFAGMTETNKMVILAKTVNAAGTKAEYTYLSSEVQVSTGDDRNSDDDYKGNTGNQENNNENKKADEAIAVGTVKEYKGQNYKILSASTVAYAGTLNSKSKKVNIPKTVQINGKTYKVVQIEKNALKGSNVQTVVIGANVAAIQNQAFAGCKKLKKIIIGVNVTSIGKAAFKDCKNLKSIIIKSQKLNTKNVGSKAFKGIHQKAVIKVPKAKLKDYKKLLKAKGAGKKVKIKK